MATNLKNSIINNNVKLSRFILIAVSLLVVFIYPQTCECTTRYTITLTMKMFIGVLIFDFILLYISLIFLNSKEFKESTRFVKGIIEGPIKNVPYPDKFIKLMRKKSSIFILSLLVLGLILFIVFSPKLLDVKKINYSTEVEMESETKFACLKMFMKFDSEVPGINEKVESFAQIIAEKGFTYSESGDSLKIMIRASLNREIEKQKDSMNKAGIFIEDLFLRVNKVKEGYPLTKKCDL